MADKREPQRPTEPEVDGNAADASDAVNEDIMYATDTSSDEGNADTATTEAANDTDDVNTASGAVDDEGDEDAGKADDASDAAAPQEEQPENGADSPHESASDGNTTDPVVDGNENNADKPYSPLPPSFDPPRKGNADPKPATTRTVVVSSVITGFITLMLSAALVGAAGAPAQSSLSSASYPSATSQSDSGNASAPFVTSDTADWQSVSEKVASSVVSIQTELTNGVAAGSGAVIDAGNGYIITNNHVVSSAKTIYVTLSNGQIYEASLKGSDATTDIAVLKLDTVPKGLKAVKFADSDALKVGQPAMAIGNPLGYSNSATTGIISALNRPVSVSTDGDAKDAVVTNAIQVDAAVNQGNSGGPLFNASGEVIGITSSIASVSGNVSSAGSIGIGFAIPSNLVKKVSESVIKDGSFTHAQLGITIKDGVVKSGDVMRTGASVESVISGGAADKAGLRKGDVIVAYNGNAVDGVESVLGYVRAASVGDTAKLTVVRNDADVIDITITLGKATDKTQVNDDDDNGSTGSNGLNNKLGDDSEGLMDKLFGGNGGF